MLELYAKLLHVEPGINIGLVGSSWTAVLLNVHTSCPLLGRDISPGKCSFFLHGILDAGIGFVLSEGQDISFTNYLDKELMNGVIVHNQLGLLTLFNHYYEQARSLPTDKLRIVYISVNAGMYFVQVCSILPLFMYCICCIPISSIGLFLGTPA